MSRREELYRQATMAAGPLLMLLCAPFFAPFERERSIYEEMDREPLALAVAAAILLWPLGFGGVSLGLSLARRPPGKVAFGVPAVLEMLVTAGLSMISIMLLADKRRARENPLVWLCAITGVLAVYLLVRGFRRAAWERWVNLLAGIWLFYVQGTLLLLADNALSFDWPELGLWLLLFALSALLPVFAWALWPRRAAAQS